jgi:phosphoribosylformylglycinamidine synthase
MGEMAVDEAVRNALSLGADYGKESDLFALNYQISFRDQDLEDPALNGILVRSCFGASRAAKELQVPIVSGVERTTSGTQSRFHFVAQATAKVGKLGGIKSGEFKSPGDVIYLLGPAQFGAVGSLLSEVMGQPSDAASAEPDWDSARRLYSWLGGFMGKEQKKLRSIHDISDGGLLVSVSECLLSRGFGALISFPDGLRSTVHHHHALPLDLISLGQVMFLMVTLQQQRLMDSQLPHILLQQVLLLVLDSQFQVEAQH